MSSEFDTHHAHPASKMKVAVLSAAHVHAASYVSLLAGRDDIDLVLADPDGYGDVEAPRTVGSISEVWTAFNGEGPDAVVVCSENAKHAQHVIDAAHHGAHVLCEKPLATTLEDAEAMIATCRDAGVILMTAYPVHFSPQVEALREAVGAGTLGEVVAVMGTNNGKLPEGRAWFTDPELSGGGALMDHVVHVAQVLDAVFGEPETVHAVTSTILHGGRIEHPVETGGLVTLTYANGMTASIDCSWSQPADATTWGGLTLHVAGTGGQARVDAFAQRVEGPGQWHDYGLNLDALMLDAFLQAVVTGKPAEPSASSGLRTLRVVKAAQDSARTGQPVRLTSRRAALTP